VKTIPLTQGQVALVDDADYEWLSAFNWYAWRRPGGTFYALRKVRDPRGGWTNLRMHRAILPDGPETDHRNRNSLDNQRHNLRPATRSQNMANIGRPKTSTSGFKGVGWHKASGKWAAHICVEQHQHHLGLFSDAEAAARAYDKAAIESFGEFACLNFPDRQTNERHRQIKATPSRSL
jgi:hypothetical protein